jgi:hypothetical protein
MKIGIDVGGVSTKFPLELISICNSMILTGHDVLFITDREDIDVVYCELSSTGFSVYKEQVIFADYKKYGDACKSVIIREMSVDIMIDDHPGYLAWPWPEPAPLRLQACPDQRRPYYSPLWASSKAPFDGFGVAYSD